jgi:hypothetical protein
VRQLFAGVFGLSVWLGEAGVVVLQHLILVAVTELARERTVLRAAFADGAYCAVLYCAFVGPLVARISCCVDHGHSFI